jgi:glycine/D-amino acid oxidase-like deaminating enzyme
MDNILAPGFRDRPYWWDAAPPMAMKAPLPSACDVAVIGSGLTGLRCALALLRAGRAVAIFDRDDPGTGASRRNAGYLGRVLKKSFASLLARRGKDYALAIYRELDAALQTTLDFIAEEGIDCHATRCGRFYAATSPAHYDALAKELAAMKQHLGFDFAMVPKAEQHREFGSDLYFGGAVIPDLGSLHPGLYHKGLLDRVVAAGGVLLGRTEVHQIRRRATGFEVATAEGALVAREVVVATNGYTPRQFTWLARRVIPFTGYVAATEELSADQLAKAIPQRRTVLDTNLDIDFFRPAPDSPRLLFGGATASGLATTDEIARRLHAILGRVLPDLAAVRLSHVWSGQCAATFDMMPHIGQADGIWYAMGYNFAGVPMGSYLGHKLALKILGAPEGKTIYDAAPFPTMPFYRGDPWFVPLAMRWFRRRDRGLAAAAPKGA